MQFFSPTCGIGARGEAISHAKTIKMTYYMQTLKFMLQKRRGMEDLCTFVFYKYLCACNKESGLGGGEQKLGGPVKRLL